MQSCRRLSSRLLHLDRADDGARRSMHSQLLSSQSTHQLLRRWVLPLTSCCLILIQLKDLCGLQLAQLVLVVVGKYRLPVVSYLHTLVKCVDVLGAQLLSVAWCTGYGRLKRKTTPCYT